MAHPRNFTLSNAAKTAGRSTRPRPSFHELEGIFRLGGVGGNVADVLEVKEESTLVIFFNGLCGVASACDQMSSIKLKLHVFRIGVFEDDIQVRGRLTKTIEMVVVAKRNAKVGRSFCPAPSRSLPRRLHWSGVNRSRVRRQLVQYLDIKTARILDELRIGNVVLQSALPPAHRARIRRSKGPRT